jgi:hypothetical protein
VTVLLWVLGLTRAFPEVLPNEHRRIAECITVALVGFITIFFYFGHLGDDDALYNADLTLTVGLASLVLVCCCISIYYYVAFFLRARVEDAKHLPKLSHSDHAAPQDVLFARRVRYDRFWLTVGLLIVALAALGYLALVLGHVQWSSPAAELPPAPPAPPALPMPRSLPLSFLQSAGDGCGTCIGCPYSQ